MGSAVANDKNKQRDADRATTDSKHKADVTYGRIKELTPGQKVVIDVDNAVDKSYDLTDKDTRVNLAANLKVGDPVKITERHVNGHKSVQIVPNTSTNVRHGDRSRSEEVQQSEKHERK